MERALETVRQYGPFIGRILIAYIFIQSGLGKIGNFAGTAAYMASKGVPIPEFFLVGAIILELGGALSLVLGWKVQWGALALLVFTLPTTLIIHNFWAVEAAQVQNQMNHFLKNFSIMGAFIYIIAYGAGPLSVDNRSRA